MTSRVLALSEQIYGRLVQLYPPGYRRRFGLELNQVFRMLCRDSYRKHGTAGVLRLWLPMLWDWAWTAVYQWITNHKPERMTLMTETLDRQLGDMITMMVMGFRAGYSICQSFEAVTLDAPEPAASAARRFLEEIEKSGSYEAALKAWKQALPSPSLARLVDLMDQQRQTGGNLADMLDTLGEELLRDCGTDPAFYEPLLRQAEQFGFKQLPERLVQAQKN
jgi:hypothetical protein